MIKRCLTALIVLGGIAHQLHADKAYVTNLTGNSVSIFNTANNTVSGTVTDLLSTFNGPDYLAFTPNGQTAYVSNPGANPNTISIINAKTDSVTGTVANMAAANFTLIRSLGITPNSTKMYVVAADPGNAVGIVDLTTDTYISNITNGVGTFPFNDPRFIAITPDGAKAYVTNNANVGLGANTVSVIDLTSDTVIAQISGFSAPDVIVMNPDGTKAYVSNLSSNSISVIDTATNAIVPAQTITTATAPNMENPYDLIFSRDGNTLYILNAPSPIAPTYPSLITVYDLVNDEVITTIPGSAGNGSDFFAFASNYNTLYITNQSINSVSIINPATNTISGTIDDPDNTFVGPYAMAMVPALAATPNTTGGVQIENIFLTQTEFVNVLNWVASSGSPVSYAVYRDAALTDLAGTTSSNVLAFQDHDRDPNTTYTYYIVAVDQNGAVSSPVVITVNPA